MRSDKMGSGEPRGVMRKMYVPAALGLLAAFGLGACTTLEDGSGTYQSEILRGLPAAGGTSSETPESGGGSAGMAVDPPAAPGPWDCLGQAPPAPVRPDDMQAGDTDGIDPSDITNPNAVIYAPTIVDWLTNAPVPGLMVCVCSRLDTVPLDLANVGNPCGSPKCFAPPAQRRVQIALPRENEGVFVALLSAATVPEAVFFKQPILGDETDPVRIRLIGASTAASLARDFSLALDPSLGVVVVRAYDCNGSPARNVYMTLSVDSPSLIPFTIQANTPTPDLLLTDGSGQFGFANVTPGPVVARAFLSDDTSSLEDDSEIGVVTFEARPSWAAAVELRQVGQ